MPAKILVHEYPLAQFGDRAGGFRQMRYPDAIVIPLTQGQFAIVNTADYPLVANYRWYAWWKKDIQSFYAATNVYRMTFMHTLIAGFSETDHWNKNTLDNRRVNLRDASHRQNMANRRKHSNNSSGHAGIRKEDGKFRVRIGGSGNNRFSLGYYDSYDDAVSVYHGAMEELYGEYRPRCCETWNTNVDR